MKISKLRSTKIHPVLKSLNFQYSVLPDIAIKKIGSFISSPMADEINKYKSQFDKDLTIPKLPEININKSITKNALTLIRDIVKNKKKKSFVEIKEDLYYSSRRMDELKKWVDNRTNTNNRPAPVYNIHNSYENLKVYNRRNYNKKKGLKILQSNWLINKSGINKAIYNVVNRDVKNMIFNGFTWYDFFRGAAHNANNSIFERNISVPIIRNLRKVVKSIDKRKIDRILIDYCKQMYSFFINENEIYINKIKRLILSSYGKLCLDVEIKKEIDNENDFVRVHRSLKKNDLLEYAIKMHPDRPMSDFKSLKKPELKEIVLKKIPDLFDFKILDISQFPYILNPYVLNLYKMCSMYKVIVVLVEKKNIPKVKNCKIEYKFNKNKFYNIIRKYTNNRSTDTISINDLLNKKYPGMKDEIKEKLKDFEIFVLSREITNIVDDNMMTKNRLYEYCEKIITNKKHLRK